MVRQRLPGVKAVGLLCADDARPATVDGMRKYLFGTGLLGAITGGLTLLRALRNDAPFTWRVALGWLSWGISLALAIGAITDVRRAQAGHTIDPDSPVHGKEAKLVQHRTRRMARDSRTS